MTGLDIGVDVDEPLFPWYERAHEASIKFGLTDGTFMPTSWAPHEEYAAHSGRDIRLEDWWEALGAALDWMYDAPPIEGAVDALWRLREAGHRVHLITARGTRLSAICPTIQEHTWKWVLDYNVPADSLTFSKDKTVKPTQWFVDDSIDNVLNLAKAGTRTYLLTMPWNAERPWPLRVNTVAEFADIILKENA
jgi:uncharacterized HAD superfamily protein